MYYRCCRCFYKTNKKSTILSHLNRKILCQICPDSYSIYNEEELNIIFNKAKKDQNILKCDDEICNLKQNHCIYCKKTFSEKFNLNKHLKNIHKQQNINIVNNIQNNIQNIQNVNINIAAPIAFDKDWDLSKIDESSIHKLLFSNVMYTKLLEEILNNKINLNVIVDDTNNSGLVYKNDIDKYVNMKLKDILDKSMNKLNKQLNDLHSELSPTFLGDYLKLSKEMIDEKIENYNINKNNINEKVNEFLINMFKNVKNDAIEMCKNIINKDNTITDAIDYFNDNEIGY